MDDVTPISKMLESPGDVIDWITGQLARFGLDLPPLVLQLFFLAMLVVFAVPVVRSLFPGKLKKGAKKPKKPTKITWIYAAALVLMAVGVVVSIADNVTMPDQVKGKVQADRLDNVRVSLLGFKGTPVSVDTGTVDSTDGSFALHYSPAWDGRARKLRVAADGCKADDGDLSRPQLRAGTAIERIFKCAP